MSFVGNLTGGFIGTSDAEKAGKDAAALAAITQAKTLGELDESWEDIEGWLNPYLEAGTEALGQYKEAIGASPDAPVFDSFNFDYTKMEDNPAYQFVKEQGLQAVNRVQARNKALTSGNRMTAINEYASGLASTEYQNEFERQLQTSEYNNRVKGMQFDASGRKFDRDTGNLSHLMTQGVNTAGNLGSFRERLAGDRTAAYGNYAAEKTAASLIPVQEKQNFINNLVKTAGTVMAA